VPGSSSEIERLIEDGLDRYGSGDLDGALMSWEKVLALDPENAQANSYVDYVRQNYEMLIDASVHTDAGEDTPFAISDEPEYLIEIEPSEMPRASQPTIPPIQIDPLDSGWFIDEETQEMPSRQAEPPPEITLDPHSVVGVTFELEAEEPPPPVEELTLPPPPRQTSDTPSGGINFEEATREYAGGFSAQTTDVKKRDLGFVQPRGGESEEVPAVGIKFRAPKKTEPPAPTIAKDPTLELGAAGVEASTDDDLLGSLPTPTPKPVPPLRVPTRDLPPPVRPPARDPSAISQAEVLLPHADTVELQRKTQENLPRMEDPNIGAPTRDLGLRPAGSTRADSESDMPTRESDARAIRDHMASAKLAATPATARPMTERTRHDISLPFDPVDAKAAQILDDVDAGVEVGETEDERSRRRITALFERAVAYNGVGDTEKALLAIDLALDEDPESALAQKMIHRNRDTAMQVFQAYLGNLERQPALAKPLHELSSAPISPRAAFLLSRIDGTLTIDEILDVSGMPRIEAYRYLCQLFLRGILK
jgi:tetratricopeptide (TPR) repeat protein